MRSCAPLGTGIYGTAIETCAAHCPPPSGSACIDGELTVTDAGGRTTSITIANGFFALELAPGKYRICTSQSMRGGASCASITFAAGQLIRVGVIETASPGGIYETLLHCDDPSHTCVVQGSAGAWCDDLTDCNGEAGFECVDASGHRPAAPTAGTCSLRKAPNAPCDQFYQCASFSCANQVCEPLLTSGQGCIFSTQCQSGVCANGLCR